MEINSIRDTHQLLAVNGARCISLKVGENTSSGNHFSGQDTLNISATASFQARLSAESKKYASIAKAESGNHTISAAELNQLKHNYQGDRCPMSGLDVAGALLNRVLGSTQNGKSI